MGLAIAGIVLELFGWLLRLVPGWHAAMVLCVLALCVVGARLELAWFRRHPDPPLKRSRLPLRILLAITAIGCLLSGALTLPGGVVMWIAGAALLLYAIRKFGI